MTATLEDLRALLHEATHGLEGVVEKRAFGSFGYFAHDSIFALAYAKGLRIGVKLHDEVSHASLMGTEGAGPWAPHRAPMRGWVLVPEAWHDDPRALAVWVRRAYEQVLHATLHEGEAAMEILHRGSTTARALEKRSRKTAAASSPMREHSGHGRRKAARRAEEKAARKKAAGTKRTASTSKSSKTSAAKKKAVRAKSPSERGRKKR